MAKFKAIVSSVRVDKDGEVKIAFSVPQSDAMQAFSLAACTNKVLDVEDTIEKEDK
ncbi:MAG: hypothetical protein ABSE82_08300 [Nitrososphaerales archaeon]|jgi:hypothetical protein